MKRYFYDCEFIEDGRTIDLASIGIVADDGREYYAVNSNVHWERVGRQEFQWIRENVWNHFPTTGPGQLSLDPYHKDVKRKMVIAREVRDFLLGDPDDVQLPYIELWGDYPAYDHVALCQLWGRMIDLPEGIPMRTNCLVQLAESLGISEKNFPAQPMDTVHHALHDARHNKVVFDSIHPEAFRQSRARHIMEHAEGVQIGNGNNQDNSFGPTHRKGEEGGEPAVSLMVRGKTWGGRAVSDLRRVFPES